MARFADQTISSFVEALGAPEPTPGGGTAAAVAGAMGAALLMMVAGLKKTRMNTEDERALLSQARTTLADARSRMLTLADADTEAYDRVLASYRLPKGTDEEKAARKSAVQEAMRGATDAPLQTLRATCEAVRQAKLVAQHGNPAASSDVRVALELLEAAAAGAAANVEINLPNLDDESYRRATASEMIELSTKLTENIAAARAALKG